MNHNIRYENLIT